MFMRLLQLNVNPDYNEDLAKFYRETVSPKLQQIDGCLFASLIKGKPEENEFISLTFWKTQISAEIYEQSSLYKELQDEATPFLSDSNEWKFQLSKNMELEYTHEDEIPTAKKYSVQLQKDEDENLKINNEHIYVRVVELKIQENKLDEFKKLYSDVIIPAFKTTKGCIQAFLTQSINEDNNFISMTIWESKKDAEDFESIGSYKSLIDKVKHTFSNFYLWKMSLEKQYDSQVKSTDDLHVEQYEVVTGKSFI